MTGTRFWRRSLLILSLSLTVACTDSGRRDAAITERIRSVMEADQSVQAIDLTITTRAGVVTLEGQVHDEFVHQRALEIVRQTAGVVHIVDRLRTPPATHPAVAPQDVPRAVRAGLATSRREPSAPEDGAAVPAVDPVLIPAQTGEIDLASAAQAPTAERNVVLLEPQTEGEPSTGDIPTPGEPEISHAAPTFDFYAAGSEEDAAISVGVRAKIDEVVPSGRVQVVTRRGVVTLSGVVDTELEKSQALRSARGVPGVERVEDRLLVLRS